MTAAETQQSIPQVIVVGAGYWGKNLIRNFATLGALHGVCDARPEVLSALKEQYPHLHTYTALEAAFPAAKAAGVDAFVVATPSLTHAQVGTAVLEAGFHLYMEKPLATTQADAEALVALAAKRDLKLMVGHLLLYHPAVIRMKEAIDSGLIGRLRYLQSDRLNFNLGRADRNVLWDLAPHDLSLLLFLAGETDLPSVKAATGIASGFQDKDAKVDFCSATLCFPKTGLHATLQASWMYPKKQVQLLAVGDAASLVLDDTLPMEQRLALHHREPNGQLRVEPLPYLPLEPLKLECQHWLNCLRHQAQIPQSNSENALAVVRLLEGIEAAF